MSKKSGLADNPLFHNPRQPFAESSPVAEQAFGRTGEPPHQRAPEPAHGRAGQRVIARKSYNVYEDQHTLLQRIEAEAKLAGQPVFMSDLVRRALDQFLKRYH